MHVRQDIETAEAGVKHSECMETASVVRRRPKTVALIMIEFIGWPAAVPKEQGVLVFECFRSQKTG